MRGDTFTWNVRDQLVGIVGTGLSASLQYDALGRRSKKILNGQTTEYLSDGINPLQEQAVAAGPWTALMMTGPGLDDIIARGDPSGVYYYLPDGLGSTVALTDGTGAVHTEYTYAPFGETTRTGTVATNPFQFTGRENDGTGLYYYRARYYHPILQRFISEDPIGFLGRDFNLYGYVRNNPMNFTDPLGLQNCSYYSDVCDQTSLNNIAGVTYYCALAPFVCKNAPDLPGFDEECIRSCLQDLDRPRCELRNDANTPVIGTAIGIFEQTPLIVADHGICFAACAGRDR